MMLPLSLTTLFIGVFRAFTKTKHVNIQKREKRRKKEEKIRKKDKKDVKRIGFGDS